MKIAEKKFLQRATFHALLYFYLMNVFYIDIGQVMGATYIIPSFLPMILFLTVGQIANGEVIFSRRLLPNFLAGLAWSVTFITVYTWTYQKPWFMSLICCDFVIGTAIFLFLSSFEVLTANTFSARTTAIILSALNFFAMLIPFIQAVYYCMFWHCLSPASLMALYLTNWRESIDFIQSNIGAVGTIIIFSVIIFLLRLAYKSHKKFCEEIQTQKISVLQKISAITVLAGTFIVMNCYIPQSSIAKLWKNVSDYVAETQKYSLGHDERFANLKIDAGNTLPAKVPGTVIFIIGESASRSYMHAFTPDFPFENTPWLDSKLSDEEKISRGKNFDLLVKVHEDYKQTEKNSPSIYQSAGDFLIFQNAYASWSQTVPVLQRALTEQSQYNNKEFYDSISIIDVAKKAGYKTYWFSNQGRYGEYDSAITLVAKTADISQWSDDAYVLSDKEDELLLKFFEQINPAENNFIVFHLMGSHIYYNNRYPRSFKKWVTADGTGMMTSAAAYANTILYTDFVLSKFFEYAEKNLNLQAMIYFSDHGEDLQISHNPDVFSFDMVRIPMFMYLSPDYEKNFPVQTEILKLHRKEFFTNDMIFDTVCGILNAPSANYDSTQDFSSADYKFNRNNLTTMLGQRKISDDSEN